MGMSIEDLCDRLLLVCNLRYGPDDSRRAYGVGLHRTKDKQWRVALHAESFSGCRDLPTADTQQDALNAAIRVFADEARQAVAYEREEMQKAEAFARRVEEVLSQ